jgi:hypothetical protein
MVVPPHLKRHINGVWKSSESVFFLSKRVNIPLSLVTVAMFLIQSIESTTLSRRRLSIHIHAGEYLNRRQPDRPELEEE